MQGSLPRHGLAGVQVLDPDGAPVGRIADTWPLDGRGEPELALVHLGRRFPRQRFLPLQGARLEDDVLHVPFTRWQIEDCPSADDHRWGDPAKLARAYWPQAFDA